MHDKKYRDLAFLISRDFISGLTLKSGLMTEYGVKLFSFANIDHTAGKIIASYCEIGNLA